MIGTADHRRILAAASEWRGQRLAIATVIMTWRSAPCPVGTHLLINEDGRFVGSVSGGCVEGDVLLCGAEAIAKDRSVTRRYGVVNADAWEAGLPCGGDIEVLIQPISERGFPPALLDAIVEAQGQGRELLIGTDLAAGISRVAAAASDDDFVNVYAPARRLLIVGGVEIAATLSQLALATGIDVTIIDPRSRFLTRSRFPDVALDDRWPDEAVTARAPDIRTAVVTLSHDPKIDDPALLAAMAFPTRYIAALGSRASHKARLTRLTEAGADPAGLARIEGPAGVAINAINSAEIALSIAAGIIRAFNDGLR